MSCFRRRADQWQCELHLIAHVVLQEAIGMSGKETVPPINQLKRQAKRLREGLARDGDFISHSESLELVAEQFGFKDWNTIYAAASSRAAASVFVIGARVSGRYLNQSFTGEVVGIVRLSPDRLRLTIDFDQPVDVVSFESFSALRRRVTCVVNQNGEAYDRTSDGIAHLNVRAA